MAWAMIVEREAQRNLGRFPERDRNRIAAALVAMQRDPFSGDVVHLKGSAAAYRRRVGAYHILFTLRLDERRIDVTNIVRRTSTTY
jgi:mRNA-degrading endonuclease RelE of RelBE toxin-antitoxin system